MHQTKCDFEITRRLIKCYSHKKNLSYAYKHNLLVGHAYDRR